MSWSYGHGSFSMSMLKSQRVDKCGIRSVIWDSFGFRFTHPIVFLWNVTTVNCQRHLMTKKLFNTPVKHLKEAFWTGNNCFTRVDGGGLAAVCVSDLLQPMDCSLPGSSVQGIFQAIILEWAAISSSRGSSQPRDRTWTFCIGRQVLYCWASREAPWQEQVKLNRKKLEIGSRPWIQNITKYSPILFITYCLSRQLPDNWYMITYSFPSFLHL